MKKYYDRIDELMDFLCEAHDVCSIVKNIDGKVIVGITELIDEYGCAYNDISSDIDTLEDICNYEQIDDTPRDFTVYNKLCDIFGFTDGFFFEIPVTLI